MQYYNLLWTESNNNQYSKRIVGTYVECARTLTDSVKVLLLIGAKNIRIVDVAQR